MLMKTCIATTALAFSVGAAHAASVLPGSVDFFFSTTYDITAVSSFDASAASKLVVTISDELGSGDENFTSIEFDSVELNLAVTNNNSIQNAYIYYLDASDPLVGGTFGTGDLVIRRTTAGNNDIGGSLIALTGTADGVALVNSSLANTTTIDTVDNSVVIAAHVNNGGDGTNNAQSPLTEVYNGDAGSAGGGAGYDEIGSAEGQVGQAYSFTGNTSRPVTVVARFDNVPEPGSLALLAVGGLLIARRRR